MPERPPTASPTRSTRPVMAPSSRVDFKVFMIGTYAAAGPPASRPPSPGGHPPAHVAAGGGGGDEASAGRALHVGRGSTAFGRGGGGGTPGRGPRPLQVDVERVLGVKLCEAAVGAHPRAQVGDQAGSAGRSQRYRGRDALRPAFLALVLHLPGGPPRPD